MTNKELIMYLINWKNQRKSFIRNALELGIVFDEEGLFPIDFMIALLKAKMGE